MVSFRLFNFYFLLLLLSISSSNWKFPYYNSKKMCGPYYYFKRCVSSFSYCHIIIIIILSSFLALLFDLLETQLHCKYIQFKCSESVVKKPENCNSPAYFPFNELHTCSGSTLENWDTVKSCAFGGSWKYLQCNLPFFFAKNKCNRSTLQIGTQWKVVL